MSSPGTSPTSSSGRDRAAILRKRLESRFEPAFLDILDESHLHAGHSGSADGRGHFRVKIVASAFLGLSPLARHRLVYAAVADLLESDIHALAIEALPPLER